MSKNPCWQYRRGEGGVESRLFADIGEVPKNQGWSDSPAVIKAEKPKPASRRKEK
jgi:hypothetical protein